MKKITLFMGMCLVGVTSLTAQSKAQLKAGEPEVVSPAMVQKISAPVRAMYPTKVTRNIPLVKTEDVEILKSYKIKEGIECQIVKDKRGFVYRRTLDKKYPTATFNHQLPIVNAAVKDTTLYEDFEAWDIDEDTTLTWLPKGWSETISEQSKAITSYDFSWFVYHSGGGGFLPQTENGISEIFIHYPFKYESENYPQNNHPSVNQDEWFISPSFTPKTTDNLYFALASDPHSCYDQTKWDWNSYTFSSRDVVMNLKIMVTEDDGKSWKELWDLEKDVAQKKSDFELYRLGFKYRSHKVELAKFVGKNIKIAYRYITKGKDYEPSWVGQSMCLDAIMVGTPEPVALYQKPNSAFFMGFSKELSYLGSQSRMLLPAYIGNTWLNRSDMYSESFVWNFADENDENNLITKTNKHSSMSYSYSLVPAPALTAHIEGSTDSTYQWKGFLMNGGDSNVWFGDDAEPTTLGCGQYEPSKRIVSWIADSEGKTYLYGKPAASLWGGKIAGFETTYPAPSSPYVINEIWMLVDSEMDADEDAELRLDIVTLDSWGYEADTLASSVISIADKEAIADEQGNPLFYTFTFNFEKPDPEFPDITTPTEIEIGQEVSVRIRGLESDKIRKFVPMNQYEDSDAANSKAGVIVIENGTYGEYESIYSLNGIYSPYILSMDVTYPFLEPETSTKCVIAAEGGSKTLDFTSYFIAKAWEISGTPDWLTVTAENVEEDGFPSLLNKVTFTATKNEGGKRQAWVFINAGGAKQTITVTQEANGTGIETAEATGIEVLTEEDNMVLTYPAEVTSVKMVNAAGQLVGVYELPASGNYTIAASNLADGVYVLEFNNNVTVKVVK